MAKITIVDGNEVREMKGEAVIAFVVKPEDGDLKGDLSIALIGKTNINEVIKALSNGSTSILISLSDSFFDAALNVKLLTDNIKTCMRKDNEKNCIVLESKRRPVEED